MILVHHTQKKTKNKKTLPRKNILRHAAALSSSHTHTDGDHHRSILCSLKRKQTTVSRQISRFSKFKKNRKLRNETRKAHHDERRRRDMEIKFNNKWNTSICTSQLTFFFLKSLTTIKRNAVPHRSDRSQGRTGNY